MNVKQLLLFSAILLISISGYAQRPDSQGKNRPAIGKVFGVVKDTDTNKPVEYATITLISKRDSSLITGGVTDKNGRFSISKIQLGIYNLAIKFIGYETYKSVVKLSPKSEAGVEQNLGVIKLGVASDMMDEIEVVAERDIMVTAIDRKVFNVAQNMTSQGGTADEILTNIPSVDVDIDGNVSLRGSESVTILINGKPSGMTGSLDQIPAGSIDRVEVITNPSAKFDPDGMAGILNIILKKNQERGMNGSVSLGIGTAEAYNFSSQINYNVGKLNLFGSYGYNHNDRSRKGTTLLENIFEDELNITNQEYYGNQKRETHIFKGGFDFYANDKNTLSMSVRHRLREQYRTSNITYSGGSDILNLLTTSDRQSPEGEDGTNTDLNFTYRKDFNSSDQNFIIDYVYSDSYELETGIYEETFYDEVSLMEFQNNYTESTSKTHTLSADYVHPIGKKAKIETGYKLINRTLGTGFESETFDYTSSQFESDIDLNNDFEYTEQIHAIYGIFGQTLGDFAYQVGLRAESALTDSRLITTNEVFENDYISLFPNAYVKYNLDKTQQVQLSYGRRINRPRTRQLNPFTDYGDPLNLRAGNPFVKPEYIDVYELNYAYDGDKHGVNFGVYYRDITDVIQRYKTVNDTTGISYTTYVNLDNGQTYGAEFIWNYRPSKIFNIMFSTNVFQNKIDASNLESELTTSGTSFSSKAMATLKPVTNTSIQVSSRYRAPFVITQGRIEDFYSTDIAIRQKVFKGKGDIGLQIRDVFNTLRFKLALEGDNFTQESYRKRESRIGMLNFTYRFGKQIKKGKNKKGGRGENSGGSDGGGDMEL